MWPCHAWLRVPVPRGTPRGGRACGQRRASPRSGAAHLPLVPQVPLAPPRRGGDDGHRLAGLSPCRCHRTLPGVLQPGQRDRAGSSPGTLRGCSEQHSSGCAWHAFSRRIFPAGARRGVADLVAPCWAARGGGDALEARDAAQGLVFQLLLAGRCCAGVWCAAASGSQEYPFFGIPGCSGVT